MAHRALQTYRTMSVAGKAIRSGAALGRSAGIKKVIARGSVALPHPQDIHVQANSARGRNEEDHDPNSEGRLTGA